MNNFLLNNITPKEQAISLIIIFNTFAKLPDFHPSENAYSNRNMDDLELKILSDSSSCPGANKVSKIKALL